MFIQTEATPNPATLKFLPGKEVLREGTADFRDADSAARRLAAGRPAVRHSRRHRRVLRLRFHHRDQGRRPDWQHLKPAILGAIMEHFMSGAPVMAADGTGCRRPADDADEFYDKADAEIVVDDQGTARHARAPGGRPGRRRHHLPRLSRTARVFLHMKGACAGCPSSTATLKHGIQNLLRHFVPEVQQVEQVS